MQKKFTEGVANTGAFQSLMGHEGKKRGCGGVKVATKNSASMDSLADDYYTVLGLLSDATPKEKKKGGYYNFLKVCHPNLSGNDPETTNFYMLINEIYEILSDPIQHMV